MRRRRHAAPQHDNFMREAHADGRAGGDLAVGVAPGGAYLPKQRGSGMLSTPFPQLILIFLAFACVVVATVAWILVIRARQSAQQMSEYAVRLQKFIQEAVNDLPETSWRAEVDATLADHRDSIAQLGSTLRRLNARNAARARHDKPADDVAVSDKQQLRELARQKGLLK